MKNIVRIIALILIIMIVVFIKDAIDANKAEDNYNNERKESYHHYSIEDGYYERDDPSLPNIESNDFSQNVSRDRLLYGGIYTETGVSRNSNNGNVSNSGFQQTFYLKIYKDSLIKTASTSYSPTGSDTKYLYIGNNNGYRFYAIPPNNMFKIAVDKDYNVVEIITSYDYRYGKNVTYDITYEVIKGDHMVQKSPEEILQEYRNTVDGLEMQQMMDDYDI